MSYFFHHRVMAIKKSFSARTRRRRMQDFVERMRIKAGDRIVDLGGRTDFWDTCTVPLRITTVNLPGAEGNAPRDTIHDVTIMEGDACDMAMFDDMSFDIAFSNSVIEHVGDETKQAQMAREMQRLAPHYWVQTPSIWFPIEAHNNMPFWWFWPDWLKQRAIRRWRQILPKWCEMVEETRVLRLRDFRRMFPGSRLKTEWKYGFVKSYILYKPTAS